MKIRVLHTADWHLTNRGTIAGHHILQEGMNLTLLDRVPAVQAIVDYARENHVDLITLPGDLFDHKNPEDAEIRVAVAAVTQLSQVAPVGIVRGNHEGGKGSESSDALASLKERPNVYVYEQPDTLTLTVKDTCVNIFCLPYPKKPTLVEAPETAGMSPEEISQFVGLKMEVALANFHLDETAVNILAGHISVMGARYSADQQVPAFDIFVQRTSLEPYDLVCLGHLHEPQEFYCGSIARGGFGEAEILPGFKVYDVDLRLNGKRTCMVE